MRVPELVLGAGVRAAAVPEAALPLAVADGLVAEAGAELLAGFLPGPALSLARPVPVLETVVTG